jgi:hypothetical protein
MAVGKKGKSMDKVQLSGAMAVFMKEIGKMSIFTVLGH